MDTKLTEKVRVTVEELTVLDGPVIQKRGGKRERGGREGGREEGGRGKEEGEREGERERERERDKERESMQIHYQQSHACDTMQTVMHSLE